MPLISRTNTISCHLLSRVPSLCCTGPVTALRPPCFAVEGCLLILIRHSHRPANQPIIRPSRLTTRSLVSTQRIPFFKKDQVFERQSCSFVPLRFHFSQFSLSAQLHRHCHPSTTGRRIAQHDFQDCCLYVNPSKLSVHPPARLEAEQTCLASPHVFPVTYLLGAQGLPNRLQETSQRTSTLR